MEKITFTCETITPMFLAGADGQTPELRAPSIKGALRFWWRAMNGQLGLEEMKEREALIFGGTSPARKSKVIVKIDTPLKDTCKAVMLPHKERAWSNVAFQDGKEFVVSLIMPKIIFGTKNEEVFNSEQVKALFLLVSALGGIGKRVRRGFGSFRVKKVEIKNGDNAKEEFPDIQSIRKVYDQIQIMAPSFFSLNNDKILFTYNGRTTAYPFIKEIEIGIEKTAPLTVIGQATHYFKSKANFIYEVSVGHASRGRFASPIFVSLLKQNLPIITSLNTVPDKNKHQISRILQEDFKTAILK